VAVAGWWPRGQSARSWTMSFNSFLSFANFEALTPVKAVTN
jgi:hypothetical protein